MQGSKRTVLPSFKTSTTTDKSTLMRSSSIHQELKGNWPPVWVNNQSTTRTLPAYSTRTQCVGNHLITFQATTTSNCYLPYKTSRIDTHITPYTRIETRTRLQHNTSTLPLTTQIWRYPHHNELLHLQHKPRHHWHLISIIQNRPTHTVSTTTQNAWKACSTTTSTYQEDHHGINGRSPTRYLIEW